ncbi:MAG TPA: Asp-tRNA(Asn)/Glu-tRNA(Gln) amidotransferase subunit GatC [Chitinophagales bacterium]|nr:Asp-tRNA(Asn)/Glu-tRNA(Gln) amidotransferase subunit GatC [Chitinophagales bacterium]
MNIDDELVNKLATLARLEFSGEEMAQLKTDLGKMIAFVSKLDEVDTTGIAPLIFLSDETNVLREDVVIETVTKAEALMNVPVSDGDYIMVPKVLRK